jgi:gliding motility-associated-like protein
MKKIIILLCCFHLIEIIKAQNTTPAANSVINSAGSSRPIGNTGLTLTDNVGEPFTATIGNSNFIITQGFLQSGLVSAAGFLINTTKQNAICVDKNDDSFISTALTIPAKAKKYTAQYFWSPNSVCPTNDCAKIDTLPAGNYSVTVIITYTDAANTVKIDSVKSKIIILDAATEPCKVKIFTGITPNGDGINDTWKIENITEFTNNKVYIYSRWGIEVFSVKGYDNKNKSWPSAEILGKLAASTYFYVIDLGDGSKPIKGWVELIKNE